MMVKKNAGEVIQVTNFYVIMDNILFYEILGLRSVGMSSKISPVTGFRYILRIT